ncbi:MAG: hypothetical protein ACYDDF_04875 [Thermoplasmatota archaeon]
METQAVANAPEHATRRKANVEAWTAGIFGAVIILAAWFAYVWGGFGTGLVAGESWTFGAALALGFIGFVWFVHSSANEDHAE